jgi:hypothetical protein
MTRIVLPAIITAIASLIVAIISVLVTARTSRRVAQLANELEKQRLYLASELEEQRAIRDARRDYEYEARKRLYAECEPLLFEAVELAERARSRVLSLARSCRQGDLRPDGSGWLAETGYYFRSTVFFLLAPMTSYKILQRRVTAIDLRLEPRLQRQYELLKLLFNSFTEDHALARYAPKLTYDPDRVDPGKPKREELLRQSPQIYRRQGLYLGRLDVASEAMIKESSGDDVSRCRTYGEFLTELNDSNSRISGSMPDIVALFKGFHPQEQPALWRILITQVLLYDSLLYVYRSMEGNDHRPVQARMPSKDQIALLDWRSDRGQATDEKVREPFVVAQAYLRREIARLQR